MAISKKQKMVKILYLPNGHSQQRQFEKRRKIYPILMAMEAEYYRKQGHQVYWAFPYNSYNYLFNFGDYLVTPYDKVINEPEGLPFLSLPHPDRIFTRWWEYQNNGNFKYFPATYIQSARDCWWRKCTFCRWAKKYPYYELRDVHDVLTEIEECKIMGFKEIFDDSGTFPTGRWLDEFCEKLDNRIKFSCNMRLIDCDYARMASAGFRMLLFGLESANQQTLDRINKGIKTEDYKYIIKASKAGLEPHVAVMFGYPWETDKDAINTLRLIWWLLKKGYAKTAQASVYTPNDNDNPNDYQRKYVKRIYDIWRSPQFWFNKIKDVHNKDDLKYLWRCIKAGISK